MKNNSQQAINEVETENLASDMYIVVIIDGNKYAIPAELVLNILTLTEVTEMPDLPKFILGIMQVRGSIVPVVNTRLRFGLPILEESDTEFLNLFKQRKQDHINWLNELDSCISDNRDFKLALDPHKCAFGKWFDSFQTNDVNLKTYLIEFDKPHQLIHSIANKAIDAKNEKGISSAKKIIEETKKNELSQIIKLFDDLPKVLKLSSRELAVVINYKNNKLALTADSTDSIIKIEFDKLHRADGVDLRFAKGVYLINDSAITVLDIPKLVEWQNL